MELMTTRTGPGGTEFLVRENPLRKSETQHGKAGVSLAPELTPHHQPGSQPEGAHEQVASTSRQRQQFWMDTCREVLEMRAPSRRVLELHAEHGCRFRVPAPHQVQAILTALDSALPGWEREHPGLFYRTLELNFPDLLRAFAVHRVK